MNCWYSCGVTTWTQPRIAANPLPENDIDCPWYVPTCVGAEPRRRVLAGDGVDLAAQRRDEPAMGHVGGGEVQEDGGVDGDRQLAVGEDSVAGAAAAGTRSARASAAR